MWENSKKYCYFLIFLVQYKKQKEKGVGTNETKNAIWNK